MNPLSCSWARAFASTCAVWAEALADDSTAPAAAGDARSCRLCKLAKRHGGAMPYSMAKLARSSAASSLSRCSSPSRCASTAWQSLKSALASLLLPCVKLAMVRRRRVFG